MPTPAGPPSVAQAKPALRPPLESPRALALAEPTLRPSRVPPLDSPRKRVDPVGTTALTSSSAATPVKTTDRVFAFWEPGIIHGYLSPGAAFTADVRNASGVKMTKTGTAGANGFYETVLSYNNGVSVGVHNGDIVRVTDRALNKVYELTVQLAGMLEEHSGLLVGTARPRAKVTTKLFTGGDRATLVASVTVTADRNGRFTIDYSKLHTPPAVSGRPLWRGYQADVEGREGTDRGAWRVIQTPNSTVLSTGNQAGGGYFLTGDTVTHELWNAGVLRERIEAVVNADGIPRAFFTVDVGQGDVFVTRFHDSKGVERTITQQPFSLTAVADPVAHTVSGITEPGAPVRGYLLNPTEHIEARANAAADGTYTLSFPTWTGNTTILVWRVSDPGFTGISVQQMDVRTPVIWVNHVTGELSGYGAHNVAPLRIEHRRGSTVLRTVTGSTIKTGKFTAVLDSELLPGDVVRVTTGTQRLPDYTVAAKLLTGHRVPASPGWRYEGEGTPSGKIVVITTTCTNESAVGSSGTWSVPFTCPAEPGDIVMLRDMVLSGPLAGSYLYRFEFAGEPDTVLTAPTGATVPATFTMTASSFDHDDAKAPAGVQFLVDGKVVAVDTVAPYSASVTLTTGRHALRAVGIDSGLLKEPVSGTTIYGQSPLRYVSV